jgi:hypothetical protein
MILNEEYSPVNQAIRIFNLVEVPERMERQVFSLLVEVNHIIILHRTSEYTFGKEHLNKF